MKKIISLIFLVASFAQAVVISSPHQTQIKTYTDLNYTVSNLVTSNSNIGDISTEIKLPLPKGLKISLMDTINLKYSLSAHNLGMGIGMTWDLPELFVDPKNPRASYVLRLDNISSEMILYRETNEYIEYRELSLQGFVKLFYFKSNQKYSLEIPNGKRWSFDENRNPYYQQDSFGNWIRFHWRQNALQKITFSYSKAELEFSYDKCTVPSSLEFYHLPIYVYGKMFLSEICLQKIIGGREKINFSYNNSINLTRVEGEESKKIFFDGSYSQISNFENNDTCPSQRTFGNIKVNSVFFRRNGVSRILQSESLPNLVGINSQYSFSDLLNWQIDAQGEHVVGQAADFNNDGLDDIHISSYNLEKKSDLGGGCYTYNLKNTQIGIFYQNNNKFDFVSFSDDQKSKLSHVRPTNCKELLKSFPEEFERPNYQSIVDLNSDGYQDIFSCHNGEAYWFENLKNGQFSLPTKLVGVLCDNYDSNLHKQESHSKEYSKMQDFTAQLFFIDLNRDGYPDIITPSAIYLNTGNSNNLFRRIENPSQELLSWQKTAIAHIKNKATGVYRIVENQSYPFFDANFIMRTDIHRNGTSQLWRMVDNSCQSESFILKHMILTSVLTEFGGKLEMNYELTPFGPRLLNLTKIISIQNSSLKDNLILVKKSYNYYNPIIDEGTRQFLGYKFVEVITHPIKSKDGLWADYGSRILTMYGIDDAKMTDIQRGPLVGLPVVEYICAIDKCDTLLQSLTEQSESSDWLEKKSYKYRLFNSDNLKGYSNPLSAQIYISKISSSFLKMKRNGSTDNPIETRYTYFQFTDLGPSKYEIEKIGAGLENLQGPQFGKDRYEKTRFTFIKYGNELLIQSKLVYGLSSFNSEGSPVERISYQYSGSKKNGDWTVTSYRSDLILEKEIFDAHGRKKYEQSFEGLVQNFNYSDQDMTIVIVNPRSSEYSKYDSSGELIETVKRTERLPSQKIEIERKEDGIPKNIRIMSEEFEYIQSKLNPGMRVEIKQKSSGEIVRQLYYDGFGRLLSEWVPFGNQWKLIQGYVMGDKSPLIEFKSALFPKAEAIPTGLNIQKQYDSLGRTVLESQLDINQNFIRGIRNEYNGSCQKMFQIYGNSESFLKQICRNESDEITLISLGKGELTRVRREERGNILNVGQISFDYDDHLRVSKIYSNNISINGAAYKNNNLTTEYENQFTVKKNIFNQIEEVLFKNEKLVQTDYDGFGRIQFQRNDLFEVRHLFNEADQRTSTIIQMDDIQLKQFFEYNSKNQIEVIRNRFGYFNEFKLGMKWDNNKLLSIDPFISSLDYNQFGDLEKIIYSNGLKVSYNYLQDGRYSGITYELPNDKTEKYENLSWSGYSLIATKYGNLTSDVESKFKYTYNTSFELSKVESNHYKSSMLSGKSAPDASKPDDVAIEKDIVLKIDGYSLKYAGLYSIAGVTKGLYKEVYVADDLHIVQGHFIEYVRLVDKIVGVIISGPKVKGFFPIITDHLNSVRVILNNEGAVLAQREYDSWGNVLRDAPVNAHGKLVSDLVRYDYAGLIRPLGSRYLISKQRVYAPHLGRWLTMDPMLQWEPSKMVQSHSHELDGYKYALGNPILFVDKTGTAVTIVPAIAGGLTTFACVAGYQYLTNGHNLSKARNAAIAPSVIAFITIGTGGFLGTTSAFAGRYFATNFILSFMSSFLSETYSVSQGNQFNGFKFAMNMVGYTVGGSVFQYTHLSTDGLSISSQSALESVKSYISSQGEFVFDMMSKSDFMKSESSKSLDKIKADTSSSISSDRKMFENRFNKRE